MVFSSVIFLFAFFPITFLVYYILDNRLKNIWLLIMSVLFYAWGEPVFVFLILLSTVVNYILGVAQDKQRNSSGKTIVLLVTILFDVGLLVYFKYSLFIADILNKTISIDLTNTILVSRHRMPIGISFFTFQILSYQIDLYRKNINVQKNIIKLALYIMLFPQMIAGPIVRYIDIAREIDYREITIDNVIYGFRRFMTGFSKKILVSNTMAKVADYSYSLIGLSGALSWLGAICYMLQIYYDFSGYSDMAIGMGKMAGFNFLENFNYPYSAHSIQDFWRRWHISLSTWFRDYLYIPLGGNRKGKLRTYINQIIVFFTTGLWHGASFNFIVWGLYHGFFLCIEKIGLNELLKKVPAFIRYIYTLFIVLIGWVFFRADTLNDAFRVIVTMFNFKKWNSISILPIVNREVVFFLIIGIFFSVKVFDIEDEGHSVAIRVIYDIILFMVFLLAILYTIGSDFNPFIYFRF